MKHVGRRWVVGRCVASHILWASHMNLLTPDRTRTVWNSKVMCMSAFLWKSNRGGGSTILLIQTLSNVRAKFANILYLAVIPRVFSP